MDGGDRILPPDVKGNVAFPTSSSPTEVESSGRRKSEKKKGTVVRLQPELDSSREALFFTVDS